MQSAKAELIIQPLNIEKPEAKRALALDALRGFAILTMFLSGRVPFGVLPDWMYHAQVPPPFHKFISTLPGITWVDLVFPFFLFSMGAAIPLSLTNRLGKGTPHWKIYLGAVQRGLLLVGFAIYDQHIRPYALNTNPGTLTWITSLLGFALLFPVLGRLPENWNRKLKTTIKVGGWIGVILFLLLASYPHNSPHGTGFSLFRSDIIILVLANVALTGTIIWMLTRTNWLLRAGILGLLIAIRLSHLEPGWVKVIWETSQQMWTRWIGYLYFQQYLFVIIPGTIAGDLIVKWINKPPKEISHGLSKPVILSILYLMISFVLVLLIGMKGRWVPETLILCAFMCVAGWLLFREVHTETEKYIKALYIWGTYWLILGLFFEPFEGGIKKDHPTLSYYFITAALASFVLIAFTILINILKKQRWLELLIDNGQNPMIGYAGITNLLPPLLALTMLGELLHWLTPTPWLGVLRAVFETILLGLLVSLFTRNKIFLRT